MIAKGNPHNDGIYLARYLASDSKGNERSELAELRGFASDNIFDAFALGQLMASGTRCENPFFHVQVRLPQGEALNREQWQTAADRIERQLGFNDQPRAIVFHLKEGGEHMHLAWSRIGKDMKALDPGLYKNKLKEISRILEKEMGLQQVKNSRDPEQKTKSANRKEEEESRRLKTDLKEIRETIRKCWDISDNGRSFTAALKEKGLILGQGNKRDFVVIDHAGGIHALSKRITGMTAKDTRDRLADIDRKNLPDVEQARSEQRERRKKSMPDQEGLEVEERKKKAIDREEEQKQEAIQKEEDRKREEGQKEEDRKQQAILDEEKRKETAFKDEENRRQQFKEQAERQEAQAKEMQLQQQRLDEYRASLDRMAEEARQGEAQRAYEAEQAAAAKELFIRDSGMRYGQALAQHYDIRDPYGSLARSAMAEYGAFLRDRENIDRLIARATDPMERKALELQKRIEAAEYMAITSNRIAAQSEIIVGRRNSEEAVYQRARAEAFQKEAKVLRKEFQELQKTRLMKEHHATPHHEPEPTVEERVAGQKDWKTQPLSEFTKTAQSRQPEKDVTHEDQKRDPSLRDLYFEGVVFKQRRDSSLEQIREDLKAGRSLNAADLRNLTRDELQKVRHWGHEHLKTIVQEHTRQRNLDRER